MEGIQGFLEGVKKTHEALKAGRVGQIDLAGFEGKLVIQLRPYDLDALTTKVKIQEKTKAKDIEVAAALLSDHTIDIRGRKEDGSLIALHENGKKSTNWRDLCELLGLEAANTASGAVRAVCEDIGVMAMHRAHLKWSSGVDDETAEELMGE